MNGQQRAKIGLPCYKFLQHSHTRETQTENSLHPPGRWAGLLRVSWAPHRMQSYLPVLHVLHVVGGAGPRGSPGQQQRRVAGRLVLTILLEVQAADGADGPEGRTGRAETTGASNIRPLKASHGSNEIDYARCSLLLVHPFLARRRGRIEVCSSYTHM